jgi:hypothetical protein
MASRFYFFVLRHTNPFGFTGGEQVRVELRTFHLTNARSWEDIGNTLEFPNAAPSPLNEERGRGEE